MFPSAYQQIIWQLLNTMVFTKLTKWGKGLACLLLWTDTVWVCLSSNSGSIERERKKRKWKINKTHSHIPCRQGQSPQRRCSCSCMCLNGCRERWGAGMPLTFKNWKESVYHYYYHGCHSEIQQSPYCPGWTTTKRPECNRMLRTHGKDSCIV